MKIYLIRHGFTDSLEKRIIQSDNEPLNEKGRVQAKRLAKRFSNTKLDLVISSPCIRALETAKEVTDEVNISKLFKEVREPKEIIGRSIEESEVKNILTRIGEMYLVDPNWHYSNEENFEDLKKRGMKALDFLISRDKGNILVVSHGNFIVLMMGLMLFNKNYTIDISLHLKNFLRLSNTGISICTYKDNKWKLQCWNDTSHY